MRTQVDVVSPEQYTAYVTGQRRDIQAAQDAVTAQIAAGKVPGALPTTAPSGGNGPAAGGGGGGGAAQTKPPNPAGAQVFAANGCGGCHALAAAGSTGAIGPESRQVAGTR